MAEFLPWQANKADAKAGTVRFSDEKIMPRAQRLAANCSRAAADFA
jgi:hypothetical protein